MLITPLYTVPSPQKYQLSNGGNLETLEVIYCSLVQIHCLLLTKHEYILLFAHTNKL